MSEPKDISTVRKITKRRLEVLQRRLQFLQGRIASYSEKDKASRDIAEFKALEWSIKLTKKYLKLAFNEDYDQGETCQSV